MEDNFETKVERLEHLGLIKAIIKDFGIDKRIDDLLPKKSNNFKVSHAQAIEVMIYLGLGFSNKRFYSVKDYFRERPIRQLLGEVGIENLNDDLLTKTLDAIYAYGSQRFFSDVSLWVLGKNNLLSKFLHMETFINRCSEEGEVHNEK